MTKMYLVMVDGKVAKKRGTLSFALKDKADLVNKGYKNVSVAYEISEQQGDTNCNVFAFLNRKVA